MKITNEQDSTQPEAAPDFDEWEWRDWQEHPLGKILSDQVAEVIWEQMREDIKDGKGYPSFRIKDDEPAIFLWLLDSHSLTIPLDEIMADEEDLEMLDADDRAKLIAVFQGWIEMLEKEDDEGNDGT
jgi:hypothetical protein